MISNMQQQNFDGVVNKMLSHEAAGLCINNNNTSKNKNMNTSSPGVMHNSQNPGGFNFITPYHTHSSENAKEYVTTASHTDQEGGFASLFDEISELMENHPNGIESAFNSDSPSRERGSAVSQEDQKALAINACRLIEDVHNYSKLNRSDESTNSSSPDDDEEFDDEDCIDDEEIKKDVGYMDSDVITVVNAVSKKELKADGPRTTPQLTRVPEEDEEKTTPEHHARRPMNAFLIFCKRHRAIVREKYKHLENRSITKILGEWWASLNADEKTSYTNLAKQYKDAFFSANPNFKWYKLPAPPLRTLSTRPSNTDRPLNHSYTTTNNHETTITLSNKDRSNRTSTHYGHDSDEETLDASEVGVFKLADEAQMGGLNSLMKSSETHNHKHDPFMRLTTDQNVLRTLKVGTTTTAPAAVIRCIPQCKDDPAEKAKEHVLMKVENTPLMNGKRKSVEDPNVNGYKRQMLLGDSNISSGEEDIMGKKSERSCKGKKYQELMNSGQIVTFPKKSKTKLDMLPNTFNHNGYVHHGDNNNYPIALVDKVKVEEHAMTVDQSKAIATAAAESPVKQFDASDFDLEEKIKALPAQSLEEYLNRKREIKKKKKINSRRHKPRRNSTKEPPPKTIQEAKERIQNQMVGSQKRKARKESITRRDINSMITIASDAGSSHIFETVELWTTTTAAKVEPDNHPFEKANNPTETTSDLLILAEVAANHIEENA